MLRVLLYGDVNLNIIDGSSVWLTSMCHVLEKEGFCEVDLLLKAPEQNHELFDEISGIKNLRLIEPAETAVASELLHRYRLTQADAVKCLASLHDEHNYHLIIVRGFGLVKLLAATGLAEIVIPYITDFEHISGDFSEDERAEFLKIYEVVRNMFVQTVETGEFLSKAMQVDGIKFQTLLPMVPDISSRSPDFRVKNYSMAYIGKFARNWHIEEIIHAMQKITQQMDYVSLNIAGNKFQQDVQDRERWILEQFNHNPCITWFGGVSRSKAQEIIEVSDIGISWRSAHIDNDNSLELSTKLLEYGRAGKPVLLRRTRQHEKLFGKDYEAFVDSEEQFIKVCCRLFTEPGLYARCAKRVYERCQPYTFSARHDELAPLLRSYGPDKLKLLFAGHDLKFVNPALSHFRSHPDFEVRVDDWQGHDKHDEARSRELLKWADIVFCEWGLGNAVWYSNNIRPGQRLVVRMHGQERLTNYPLHFDANHIDLIITVSPYMYELFHRSFGLPRYKFRIINNMVDTEALNEPKAGNDIQFNLGIAGILPKLKRPDKAIEILEKLHIQDRRYKLFIKSRKPQDLPWLMSRPDEQRYYEQLEKRIQSSPARDNIIFEPHGNDMAEWFRKIGYILSTSEFESFHLTPLEGMAAGTVPVILNWPGSRSVHDPRFIFDTIEEAVKFILDKESQQFVGSEEIKQYVINRCCKNKVINQIEEALLN